MKTVGSSELKKHFGRYKRALKRGQSFIITRYGKIVAKIAPVSKS